MRLADVRFHRRALLANYCGSLGGLALAQLCSRRSVATASSEMAAPAQAKSVICLFQHGGPSQMDLFDPKPELSKRNGQKYPGEVEAHFHEQQGALLGSPFRFAPCGESGVTLSETLPYTGRIVDDLTIVRSMATESVDHEAALRLIHTGKLQAGRPTWGAWVSYALGTENEDLPAYVVLADPGGLPVDGVRNWSNGWLPAIHQGVTFRSGDSPILDLSTPADVTPDARRRRLATLERLNRAHLERRPGNSELEARIDQFETAARMQMAAPEALDLSRETEAARAL